MLGVCLTGELRWFPLSLAHLRHFLLAGLGDWRAYYVGPATASFTAAIPLLPRVPIMWEDVCAYEPEVRWVWRDAAANAPHSEFERHGVDVCAPTASAARPRSAPVPPPRLEFDVSFLPLFRRCFPLPPKAYGRPPIGLPPKVGLYNRTRSQPCAGAISMTMQLWQAATCARMVSAAEARGAPTHTHVLRMRPDLFFFAPVVLPVPPKPTPSFYSLLEESCDVRGASAESAYGRARGRFIQDFWIYGERSAMEVILREPLRVMLQFGLDSVALLRPGATPKYHYHPVIHAIYTRLYNASTSRTPASCVRYRGKYGLLRVNPTEACFTVQGRVGVVRSDGKLTGLSYSRTWEQIGLRSIGWEATEPLYASCFGLTSNASCPRIVGDTKLTAGAEASCFRFQASTTLANRCQGGAGTLSLPAGVADGTKCMVDGLAKVKPSVAVVETEYSGASGAAAFGFGRGRGRRPRRRRAKGDGG